mgnify:CR=1 FL=1
MSKGGYPNDRQYDRCMRLFRNINSLDYGSELKKDINIENISYKNDIKVVNFSLNSNKKSSNQEARIAIASIGIDSEKDVIDVLKNPDCGLTIEKKLELYRMLNEAREQGASMVVFPEYYLPVQWLPDIMYFCRKNKIIVVSGLRYICIKDNEKNCNTNAFNYVAIINPSIIDSRYVYAVPIIREKTYYAPEERKRLGELLFSCKNPEKVLHVINTGNYKYSDLMCYELTNIEYRYLLRGRIELLLIPENNKDTNYFSSIVDSASRDLHCFIIQVNTSQYGDSRITGPYKTLYKDIAKIKGGDNDLIIIGSAKYGEIIENAICNISK